jgi:hypothetical protein
MKFRLVKGGSAPSRLTRSISEGVGMVLLGGCAIGIFLLGYYLFMQTPKDDPYQEYRRKAAQPREKSNAFEVYDGNSVVQLSVGSVGVMACTLRYRLIATIWMDIMCSNTGLLMSVRPHQDCTYWGARAYYVEGLDVEWSQFEWSVRSRDGDSGPV